MLTVKTVIKVYVILMWCISIMTVKMIFIWTLLSEFLIDWNSGLPCINCVCSGIYAWIWPLSLIAAAWSPMWCVSAPYFPLKWGVQRSAVSHHRRRPNGRASCSSHAQDSCSCLCVSIWEQTPKPYGPLAGLIGSLCEWWLLLKGRRGRRWSSKKFDILSISYEINGVKLDR